MERTTKGATSDRLVTCTKIVVQGAAESVKILNA